jgi:hypothetical protein
MALAKVIEAMPGLQFGADPELFVIDTDGKFVSAEGLIPGTKDEPFKVEYGAVQVDGVAAEFNIDPVTNFKNFSRNINEVRKQLKDMLPTGYDLVCTPTAQFEEDSWAKVPEKSKVLGCSPDYNAWTKSVNPPPIGMEGIRHAGGHVHIGWTEGADTGNKEYVRACLDLIRQLDWYLGLWSVTQDADNLRRTMYGKAGSMRFKPYGVEYRTLSNFWLKDETTMRQMWNRLQTAIHDMSNCYFPTDYVSFNSSVVEAINESNKDSYIFNEFKYPAKRI